ncbi:MAG: heavy-metal-associated domain-containing protein [Candidatus Ancillula sp.]|jgi:Cu+-exporting ATPase|nr:heavy-metal-associated domain-containing protein [Candidatus Ancillula sp.]
MVNYQFKISGMSCANCQKHVEKALNNVNGIESAVVNLVTEIANVKASDTISKSELIDSAVEAVSDAGYKASLLDNPSSDPKKN